MTPKQALHKYENKRKHCIERGIPFTLTFKDWVDAWGDQIAQHGVLQLQRIDKEKGFVPGNIRLGPKPEGNHAHIG